MINKRKNLHPFLSFCLSTLASNHSKMLVVTHFSSYDPCDASLAIHGNEPVTAHCMSMETVSV